MRMMMDVLLGMGYGEELINLLGSVVLVATMGVVMLAELMGMTMVMRINTRSGEWNDVGTQRWTMTIYY